MRHGMSSNRGCHMQSVRLQRQNQRLFQLHDVVSIRPPRCSRKTRATPSCQKHLHPAPLLPQLMLLTLPVDTLEASHLLRSHPKASVHRTRAPCTPRYGPYRSPVMDPGIGAGAPHPLFTSISRHLSATSELFFPNASRLQIVCPSAYITRQVACSKAAQHGEPPDAIFQIMTPASNRASSIFRISQLLLLCGSR